VRYVVIGGGHLSQYIRNRLIEIGKLSGVQIDAVENWDNLDDSKQKSILVHVGSGRQLNDVIKYSQKTNTPLIQASTGINYLESLPKRLRFILVEAPNLSIPIIKLLYALKQCGNLFSHYEVTIAESHQSRKTSLPATAKELAEALNMPVGKIKSVRDLQTQRIEYHVPEEYLDAHAIHIVNINEGSCKITIKTEALGYDSYLYGIVSIARAMEKLKNGSYFVTDLVDKGII
jgi:4-hydroxy-tetrahydrodipicolinate reductase